MFKIIQKTFDTGLVTIGYPDAPAQFSLHFRGAPRFDFPKWRDARPAAEVCPTNAISVRDSVAGRHVTVNYGLCIFCGECAEADPTGAVRMSGDFELAVRDRNALTIAAEYELAPD